MREDTNDCWGTWSALLGVVLEGESFVPLDVVTIKLKLFGESFSDGTMVRCVEVGEEVAEGIWASTLRLTLGGLPVGKGVDSLTTDCSSP